VLQARGQLVWRQGQGLCWGLSRQHLQLRQEAPATLQEPTGDLAGVQHMPLRRACRHPAVGARSAGAAPQTGPQPLGL
jgi:hypothetical protein